MVSHPELGSDPPIGSDRESGCDTSDRRCYGYSPADSSSIAKSSVTGCSYSSAVSHRENGKISTHGFPGEER